MLPPHHNGLSVESLLRGVFLLNDLLLYSTNLVPFETNALFKGGVSCSSWNGGRIFNISFRYVRIITCLVLYKLGSSEFGYKIISLVP